MSALFEGDFQGKVTKAEFGTDKNGKPQLRATIEIVTEGERKGVSVGYSGNFKTKDASKYTRRDMIALGWKGNSASTFVSDVMTASQGGLTFPFSVRTAEWIDSNGKLKRWNSASNIGYQAPPLNAADSDTVRQVDSWLAEADPESQPPAHGGYGSGNDDDSIPF